MSESVCARKLIEMEDLDENIISNDPWAQELLDVIMKLTKKGVLNWLTILRKIGETTDTNEKYGHLLVDNITSLYEDLILDMDIIREKLLDKLIRMMDKLENFCKDLQIQMPEVNHEQKPLAGLLNELEMTLTKYEDMVNERIKKIQAINNEIKSLSNEFGRQPKLLMDKSPLPTEIEMEEFEEYIKQLEFEKDERIEKFHQIHYEILQLTNDLDYNGRTNFEKFILTKHITNNDYQIIMKDKEFDKIVEFHNELIQLKQKTIDEIHTIKEELIKIWQILEYDLYERDQFILNNNKITSLITLENYRNELKRCELLKKENLKKFIEQQRCEIYELWLKCNLIVEQQKQQFKFYNSDCYTEDLFDLHAYEINKLKEYYNDNKVILQKINDYRRVWMEFFDLETKCDNNKDRYKNRGGQLLIEEKLRNKLKKQLTKLEIDLNDLHHNYLINNGCEFLTYGQTIPEFLKQLHNDLDKKCKEKLSAKKMEREKTQLLTATKSRMNLFPSTSNLLKAVSPTTPLKTPTSCKRKLLVVTPRTGGGGGSVKKLKNSPKSTVKMPKLNVSIKRRSSKKYRNLKKKKPLKTTATTITITKPSLNDSIKENNVQESVISSDYNDFEKDLSKKHDTYRSTSFKINDNNDNDNGRMVNGHIQTPKKTPLSVLPHGSKLNMRF